MPWKDKLLSIFKSEAKDVKQGLDSLKSKMDEELTKRETEMAATPAERLDMIKGDIKSSSSRLDEIGDDIAAGAALTKAKADVNNVARGESLEDKLERQSAQSPEEAISEAVSDAHAETGPETLEPAQTVQEKAEETLDELRAELGLETEPDSSADG